MASAVADRLGRRWGLIASCMVFNVGVALQVAATEQKLLIAGRAVAGFGVGLVSAIGNPLPPSPFSSTLPSPSPLTASSSAPLPV